MTRAYKNATNGRALVLNAILKNPGATLTELTLLTDLAYQTIQYHRNRLTHEGLIGKQTIRSRHPQAVKSAKRHSETRHKASTLEERIEEIVRRDRENQGKDAPQHDVIRHVNGSLKRSLKGKHA